jgi:hypothetical protein
MSDTGGTFDTSGLDVMALGRLNKHLDTRVRYDGAEMFNREIYTRYGTGKGIYQLKSNRTGKIRIAYKLHTSLDYTTYLEVPKLVHDTFIPNSGHVEALDPDRICTYA